MAPGILRLSLDFKVFYIPDVKVKLSRYRPGQAFGVPGG
jgi:hypothetical protein